MKHILVVEDDAVNALLFRMILEKRGGFQVTVTESPDEVFELVRGGTVDLVIMDISLSHSHYRGKPVGGVELCGLIKDDPAMSRVPVVLATAYAMRGDAEALLRDSGAEDYVAKPIIDHAAFVDQIKGYLREAA